MNLTPILIGAPVRNRGWILPHYLKCLEELNYPPEKLRYVFILNDSTDNSEALLQEWLRDRPGELRMVNLGTAPDNRSIAHRKAHVYSSLAFLRNLLLQEARPGEYFFSCDTDIMFPPHTLRQLIMDKKDVVAATISNVERGQNWRLAGTNASVDLRVSEDLVVPSPHTPGLREVKWTGAIYLIGPQALQVQARYGNSPLGEDYPFCQSLRGAGITLWQDGDLLACHCIDDWDLLSYLEGRYWEDGYAYYLSERALQKSKGDIMEGCLRCCGNLLTTPPGGLGCALAFQGTSAEDRQKYSICRLPILWNDLLAGRITFRDINPEKVDQFRGWFPPPAPLPAPEPVLLSSPGPAPPVVVASLVRNRAWVLPEFLDHLAALQHDGPLFFAFWINNCEDNSKAMVEEWLKERPGRIFEADRPGLPPDRRWNLEERKSTYPHLANLRNLMLDYATSLPAWSLLSVDSDVLLPPHALTMLLDAQAQGAEAVAAVVSNDLPGSRSGLKTLNASLSAAVNRGLVQATSWQPGLTEVKWTGACMLLSPRALQSGARYDASPAGEDLPFCRSLRQKKIKMYLHGDVITEHILCDVDLLAHQLGRYWDDIFTGKLLDLSRRQSVETVSEVCCQCTGGLVPELGPGGTMLCPVGEDSCPVRLEYQKRLGGSYGQSFFSLEDALSLIPARAGREEPLPPPFPLTERGKT